MTGFPFGFFLAGEAALSKVFFNRNSCSAFCCCIFNSRFLCRRSFSILRSRSATTSLGIFSISTKYRSSVSSISLNISTASIEEAFVSVVTTLSYTSLTFSVSFANYCSGEGEDEDGEAEAEEAEEAEEASRPYAFFFCISSTIASRSLVISIWFPRLSISI